MIFFGISIITPSFTDFSAEFIARYAEFDFGGYVEQKYLSKNLKFVELKDIGYEAKMKEWIKTIANTQ